MVNIIELTLDGDSAWPDIDPATFIYVAETTIGVTVRPGGMASGREAVAFRFTLPDGRDVIAETSWRAVAAATLAIAGRYGWPD
jgi:hypothetical protein